MKTFRQFLAESVRLNEAVADIPADLKEVINKHYHSGMKQFLDDVYRSTSKDLNDLEMSNDNFIRTTKIKESDLNDVVKERDKILVINVFERDNDMGVIYLGAYMTDYYLNKRETEHFEVNYRNYRILGRPRNVATILNAEGITYKAWIIDLSKAKSTEDLQRQRREAQENIIKRYDCGWNLDKSGYQVDKSKYKKMLAALKKEGNVYVDRISKISAEYFDVLSKLDKSKSGISFSINDAAEAMKNAIAASVDTIWNDNKKITSKIDDFERLVKKLKNNL